MPRNLLPFDSRSRPVEGHLLRHAGGGGGIYLAVLTLVILALAALPLVRVPVTVQAIGLIRPEVERHEVRAAVSGLVEEVLVTRNDPVEAGAELLRVRDIRGEAARRELEDRLAEIGVELADLRSLLAAGGAAVDLRTPRYRDEAAQLLAELRVVEIREQGALRDVELARELERRGLVPRRELEDRDAALAALGAERILVLRRYLAGWSATRDRLEREARERSNELREIGRQSELNVVLAPVAGVVDQLAPLSRGSWVGAGEPIAVISPDTAILAEVWIPSRDVGLIRPGSTARVLVDAYRHDRWGALEGRIISISDDQQPLESGPAFRAVLALDRAELRLPGGVVGPLRKGMAVRARFTLVERSLLRILLDDVADWFDPQGSEAHPPVRVSGRRAGSAP